MRVQIEYQYRTAVLRPLGARIITARHLRLSEYAHSFTRMPGLQLRIEVLVGETTAACPGADALC